MKYNEAIFNRCINSFKDALPRPTIELGETLSDIDEFKSVDTYILAFSEQPSSIGDIPFDLDLDSNQYARLYLYVEGRKYTRTILKILLKYNIGLTATRSTLDELKLQKSEFKPITKENYIKLVQDLALITPNSN